MIPSNLESQQGNELNSDQQRRNALARLIQPMIVDLGKLEMMEEHANVQHLLEVVTSDTFKLLIMGEFKTGKSTFINALLGEKILPSYATPTTAIINEVKYGDTPCAVLHFRDQTIDPQPIPVEDLEKYVVIQDSLPGKVNEIPYSHVELFWNLELCRNRVDIIDSPGLNENDIREKVTLDYLRKVDGVIFVLLASRFWSLSEQETVKLLTQSGHTEIFFVVNQFDLIDTERDRDKVYQFAKAKLGPQSKRKDAIYFVSARDALKARLTGNKQLLEESGFIELQSTLQHFLWDERSRIKVRRAANELQLMIARAQMVIPDKRQMLLMPLQELEQRYKDANKQFHQVELDKAAIIRRYESFRRDMRELVRGKVQDFYSNLDQRVEEWVKAYPLKLKLSLGVRTQIAEGVKEISEDLNLKISAELDAWTTDILIPFVEERLGSMKRELEHLAENFEANLRRARLEVLGATLLADDLAVGKEGPKNALERILAAAGGFFIAGAAGAGLGAVFGWREVVNSFIPQVLAITAALIIGLPILPFAIIAALVQGGLVVAKILNRVKDETAKAYRQKLRESTADQADKVANHIDQQLSEIQQQLERGLQVRINSVTEQVDATLSVKKQGEDEVHSKLELLKRAEQNFGKISVDVIGYIARLDKLDDGEIDDGNE